jgi:hypothetical protein
MFKRITVLFVAYMLFTAGSCKNKPVNPRDLVVGKWKVGDMVLLYNATEDQRKLVASFKKRSYIEYRKDSTYQAYLVHTHGIGKWYLYPKDSLLITVSDKGDSSFLKIMDLEQGKIVLQNAKTDENQMHFSMTLVPFVPFDSTKVQNEP